MSNLAARDRLLAGEDDPVSVINEAGASALVFACEHAGRRIPKALKNLGLDDPDLIRHIAWDIGAEAVARRLAASLDAPLVLQRYSRLVYDCNRPPEAPSAIPTISETTPVPGNEGLTEDERAERAEALYRPFHACVGQLLDRRIGAGLAPIFVTIHSFTPIFKGMRRDLHLGILHDRDRRFADLLLDRLALDPGIIARRNEPYGPQDGVCHTLDINAATRGLPHAMIEIRNDLIADQAGQDRWVQRLAGLLRESARAWAESAAGGGSRSADQLPKRRALS